MEQTSLNVRLEIATAEVKNKIQEIISSIDGVRVREEGACDLHFHEVGRDMEREFREIRSLKESGEIENLFLTSPRTESDILIKALRAGAVEYISQPINGEEVREAFARYLKNRRREFQSSKQVRKGKIVTVIGSKGGVGTTTTAVNLASFLNELGGEQSVALIDMNLVFGEIPLFLDVEPAYGWGEVVRNFKRLDATYLKSVLSMHPSGIAVLPPSTDFDGTNLASPEIVEELLRLMGQEFDYIVIDCGQLLDAPSLKILELSDTVLLVATQNLPCLINMRRLLETFRKIGYPREDRIKVVMNRYQKKSSVSRKDAEEGIGKKISWLIPNDYGTTMSAIHQGKMLSSVASNASITRNFRDLARSIDGKHAAKNEKDRRWALKIW